ncbi:hypothetical protein [Streptomyces sp. NPDC046727]|uniref:hypothetical protein n=1 Tax=Streptomyces sp. NPDC046727 TaxID=3155373 RepID=UPI0034092537
MGGTVLAAALLPAALLLPDQRDRLTPAAFLRLPAEGIVLAALLLVLLPCARRDTAAATGAQPQQGRARDLVARDPKVPARISGWGWSEGLRPTSDAPVRAMDAFRDRFLGAYGPQPGRSPSPG